MSTVFRDGGSAIINNISSPGCLLALTLACMPAAASNAPRVVTDKGVVAGVLTADRRVVAFRGIPYAAPPIGDLRWKPPLPAQRWRGVKPAVAFGSRCIQTHVYAGMTFRDPGEREDCLTLNVWAPAGATPGTLPVMVWIYGGGLTSGSTSESRQDGQFLAHRNVVVVSMNYRLGVFGFLALAALTAESPHHASGNYGLLDQAAAIAWVVRNIAAFGGNPANITLFGESAGSYAVSAHLASPLVRDLVQKAIGESGAAFYETDAGFVPREQSEQANSKFLERAFHTTNLAALRHLPARALVRAATATAVPAPPHMGPVIDGYFLPDSVPSIYAAGRQAHVPLLAGWNADEIRAGIAQAKEAMTADRFRREAQADFGADVAAFLALYPAASDSQAVQSAGDFASDRFIAYSTWRWLETQVRTAGAPVYRYRLDLGAPTDALHPIAAGAFHADDIEYVFGTLDSRPGAVWRPEDRQLSDLIGTYWTNFARTSDPNQPPSAGLPPWPIYHADDGWQVMHLDAVSAARADDDRSRYLFLDLRWGPKP